MVHIQSATFSAIRITSIINAYKNFYPLVSVLFVQPTNDCPAQFRLSVQFIYHVFLATHLTPDVNCNTGDLVLIYCQ